MLCEKPLHTHTHTHTSAHSESWVQELISVTLLEKFILIGKYSHVKVFQVDIYSTLGALHGTNAGQNIENSN